MQVADVADEVNGPSSLIAAYRYQADDIIIFRGAQLKL